MSNHSEESNQGDLGTLPEKEQKDTKEILDQIEKDEAARAGESNQDDAAKAEAERKAKEEADAKAKADAEAAEAERAKQGKKEDRSKFVPSWVLEKERTQAAQKIADLEKSLAEAAGSRKGENGEETKVERIDRIKETIKKHNIDVSPEFMEEIVKIASEGKEMPADFATRLADLDKLKHDKEVEAEEVQFSADFEKNVVPMIKAEFGDDVDPTKIAEFKESLKALAYTQEYAKVPYDVIYRGRSEFRTMATAKKRSAEGARGGSGTMSGGEKDYTSMTEEEAKNLSGEEFDKWSDAMARAERNKS